MWYQKRVNNKHQKILNAIFADPVLSSLLWSDIESLLLVALK